MSEPITIALDAMGGDHAPDMVVRGANLARSRFPDAHFVLFGDETKVKPLLARLPKLAKVCTIVHTDQVVGGEDKPSIALRTSAYCPSEKSCHIRSSSVSVNTSGAAGLAGGSQPG